MINSYKINKSGTIITVQDFLTKSYDLSTIEKDWWYVALNDYEGVLHLRDIEENLTEIKEKSLKVVNTFNAGHYSYCFKRTVDNHYDTCICQICEITKFFRSDEMISELSKIVDEDVTEINETFCSKYETGDFLSLHHDKKKGDYAFIYQLTKDWNPCHGATLQFWDSDTKKLNAIYPEYNSLTIFKLKDIENTEHFVSMNVCTKPRFAFSGWFTC